jgi:hypothetical protein
MRKEAFLVGLVAPFAGAIHLAGLLNDLQADILEEPIDKDI